MSQIFANLHSEQSQQQATLRAPVPDQAPKRKRQRKTAGKVTPARDHSRGDPRNKSRDRAREKPRNIPRDLPTRDEIQLFSFHLRDQLKAKAKIQAEVPPAWQEELEALAGQLNVKKLELYRYILGAFLGKTGRGRGDHQ